MDRVDTTADAGFFDVVAGIERPPPATMTLAPGSSTGGPTNAHATSDQWLSVVSGSGTGTVEGRSYDLAAGTLLLIEPGETHGIENTGSEPLATIAVSAPREY